MLTPNYNPETRTHNAGDLSSPDPEGIRTYSIPHTWFYEERHP